MPSSPASRRLKAFALYSAAVPISIVLAFGLTTIAFKATEVWSSSRVPDWTVVALNILPPVAAGVATSLVLVWVARGRGWHLATVREHVIRLALAYALSATIVGLIVANRDNRDFGLWSQIIEWPLAALIGLALVDLAATLSAHKRGTAQT